MSTETKNMIERMFEVGAHFGFSKSRRHPTTAPFIYTTKDGNDIFDLEKTSAQLAGAVEVVAEAGKQGKKVLLVGTKDEVSALVAKHAEVADMPYVKNRWIGGLLTNFTQMKKRCDRLQTLRQEKESGELDRKYTKKERVVLGREMDKLSFNFGGIVELEKTPDLLIIVDPRHDAIANTEARELGIPVIGLMSSDSDISKVTHPVLINDALTSSVDFVLGELVASYKEGVAKYVPPARKERTRRPRVSERRSTQG